MSTGIDDTCKRRLLREEEPRSDHLNKVPKAFFLFSILATVFVMGLLVERFRLPPYHSLHEAWGDSRELIRFWKNDFGLVPVRHLVRARSAGSRLVVQNPSVVAPGYRLISGVFPQRPGLHGAILLDRDGRELHYWPIDYDKLHYKIAADSGRGAFNVTLHGTTLLRDGSLVVNFDDGDILARIDKCGDPIWVDTGHYNHPNHLSYDGTIWVWKQSNEGEDQLLVNVDPVDGRVLREVSLEEIIRKNKLQGELMILQAIDETNAGEGPPAFLSDPFHPNSVDILAPDMARAFPAFHAGDILISLRSLNFVGVFDGRTFQFLWGRNGPWHRQHDAMFLGDGTISIFNNNAYSGQSSILRVNPTTNQIMVAFEGSSASPFYTRTQGKHQYLKNGSILITEAQRGAVIEVDKNGKVVWEYNNVYDHQFNGALNSASIVAEDELDLNALKCGNPKGRGQEGKVGLGLSD
jgi:hypothetical protein